MTKEELIKNVAQSVRITQDEAQAALEQIVFLMAKEVKQAGRFALTGFGIFTLVNRKAKQGRNPQTGKPINIPAKKVVKFKMAKELKRAVNPS